MGRSRRLVEDFYESILLVALLQSLIIPYDRWQGPSNTIGPRHNLLDQRKSAHRLLDDARPHRLSGRSIWAFPLFFETDAQLEPSIEDIDLIDVLWRQDIDIEKGRLSPSSLGPDNQDEHDVQMLTEKHFAAPPHWGDEDDFFASVSKTYDELLAFQQQYVPGKGAAPVSSEDPFDNGKAAASAIESQQFAKAESNLDWLFEDYEPQRADWWKDGQQGDEGGAYTDPLSPWSVGGVYNDVCLSSACADAADADGDPHEQQQTESGQLDDTAVSESNVLDEFFEAPVDWQAAGSTGDDGGAASWQEIATPTLDLAPDDVSRWFTDAQVLSDVADSAREHFVGLRDDQPSTSASPSTSRAASSSPYLDQASVDVGGRVRRRSSPIDWRPPNAANRRDQRSLEAEALTEVPIDWMDIDVPIKREVHSSHSSVGGGSLSPPANSNHVDHDHMYLLPISEITVGTSPFDGQRRRQDSNGSILEGKLIPHDSSQDSEDDDEEDDEDAAESSTQQRKRGRQSKDEELARQWRLPLTARQIGALPLTAFQSLLRSTDLSSEQKDVVRKIRRRGKNKLAARNCRKRQVNSLSSLEMEASLLEQELRVEAARNERLRQDVAAELAAVALLDQQNQQQR